MCSGQNLSLAFGNWGEKIYCPGIMKSFLVFLKKCKQEILICFSLGKGVYNGYGYKFDWGEKTKSIFPLIIIMYLVCL